MLKLAERVFIAENCDFVCAVVKQFNYRVCSFKMNRFKYSYLHCPFFYRSWIISSASASIFFVDFEITSMFQELLMSGHLCGLNSDKSMQFFCLLSYTSVQVP